MDAEWKPTFGLTTDVALIQLATRNVVYLVDVVTLDLHASQWGLLGKYVFNNEEILKLGFAPTSDLSMLQKSLPSLNLASHSWSLSSYLDLQQFWRKLNSLNSFQFPYPGENTNENLSNLVKKCLGKKLDKSNQFSNWEKRPLRSDQIIYAALDSYCLIEIYDVLERELTNMGINFEEFLFNFLTENKGIKQIKKKEKSCKDPNEKSMQRSKQDTKNAIQAPVAPEYKIRPKAIKVHEIQFVADSMLGGLGKTLRKCGIDCRILQLNEHSDECIKIAVNEVRCIVTRGQSYNKVSQCF